VKEAWSILVVPIRVWKPWLVARGGEGQKREESVVVSTARVEGRVTAVVLSFGQLRVLRPGTVTFKV
jgi:hypothetical protein